MTDRNSWLLADWSNLKVAWTAMDQTYGATTAGAGLKWIDNAAALAPDRVGVPVPASGANAVVSSIPQDEFPPRPTICRTLISDRLQSNMG
jgi:hypothetical protein